MQRVLLLGRTEFDRDTWSAIVGPDMVLETGTTIEALRDAFESGPVDHVIMGAGLTLQTRLEVVQAVFELSDTTTVHLKDRESGREGMEAFVSRIVGALAGDE